MPTKLGVGVEGGFSTEEDKYEIVSRHSIVVMEPSASGIGTGPPTVAAELPYEDGTKSAMFPPEIVASADSVLCHAGLMAQQDVQSWQLDDEVVPVSKYAESLPFVDNGVAVDPNPKGWRCQKSGEASDNLWLNLSTGYIGGGRKNWDGSGGSNGALDHFHETGNLYPLVVKLGTISSDLDAADCYSYAPDEDGPVKVPNLPELLQRRGINVAAM
jgi:ubiquitin carboxyl-terminal hydrolase 5/13